MERVVLDPAVLVSAVITPRGNPAPLWRAVVDQQLEIVTSPNLLAELAGVLERPKFRPYTTTEEARAFVAEVADRSHRIPDPADVPGPALTVLAGGIVNGRPNASRSLRASTSVLAPHRGSRLGPAGARDRRFRVFGHRRVRARDGSFCTA